MADQNEQDKLYDCPGKRSSRCWKYFGFVKIKPGPPSKETLDMKTAVCKICRKSYANNANTSNFLTHIDNIHPDAGLEDRSEGLKQPKISFEKPKPKLPKTSTERKSILDNALAKLVVGKMLPTSLADNEFFKSFVGLLDPKYDIPSRRTLHRQLQNKQEQMAAQIKSYINQCKSVAITHDGWTSLNTESYNTTTVHAIDNEWQLRTLVLDTKKMEGSHTSEKIETKRNWNLPEDIIATTDNAANEKKAFALLNWERFGCYGHRINLIVRHALKVPEVNKLLTKARKLVTFFHTSSSC